MAKKIVLGKGLGALIKQSETELPEIQVNTSIDNIDINKIDVNPEQPRKYFDREALDELASSIKQLGIIQPITVRKTDNERYQIIAGERRYRASMIAGLNEIPAYIRDVENDNLLALALVENIQREDLDAIEIALSYQRLIDECQLIQEDLVELVGKQRSTISNYLRLLKLPAEVQLAIKQKQISMGHARALVNIEQAALQIQMLNEILEKGLSVRQVETAVRQINSPEPEQIIDKQNVTEPTEPEITATEQTPEIPESPEQIEPISENEQLKTVYEDPLSSVENDVNDNDDFQNLKSRLSERFGTKVDIKRTSKGSGQIVIPFKSDAEFRHILKLAEKIYEN